MSNDWPTLKGKITDMTAAGNTNQAVGMAWGALAIGLIGGWLTAVTGGIAAAFLGHAATRFAVFLATGHTGQTLPKGREAEEIDRRRRPPEGWRVIGTRESAQRDR